MNKMKEAILAQETKNIFLSYSSEARNKALHKIAEDLMTKKNVVLQENAKDIQKAKEDHLSQAMIDRLLLTPERIDSLARAVLEIAKQEEVVGKITQSRTREDGLIISKQRIPIGVIAMIFESRPNVVVDCSALAIKSGNCIILKGGKEASNSNHILAQIIRDAISEFIPKNVVQMIETRDDVTLLLDQVGLIDVIIPRGGEGLINYITANSKVPVLAHYKGLCHIFVDESANSDSVNQICLNAKTSRPGVCNAMETLLIHKNYPIEQIKKLIELFQKANTELRVDQNLKDIFPSLDLATQTDWQTEYLDNILSLKIVDNLDEAIKHIQTYGSHHTEAILSNDENNIKKFQNSIDASSIMVNASTRFNDGGEYGLGAELGISTSKLHAYGPMGAEEMTTERFLVTGSGHIR